jgi:hypothetical protein
MAGRKVSRRRTGDMKTETIIARTWGIRMRWPERSSSALGWKDVCNFVERWGEEAAW